MVLRFKRPITYFNVTVGTRSSACSRITVRVGLYGHIDGLVYVLIPLFQLDEIRYKSTEFLERLFIQNFLTALALTRSITAMSTSTMLQGTQYVGVGRGKIAFDDSNSEGAVVLGVPGMGDTRSQYRFLRPLLVEAGFRFISMDVRGFGETSAEWDDYSARAIGDDIVSILSHLKIKSAIILGNSFAAGSGLWAAHSAPDLVKGVIMLGPILRDLPLSFFTKGALKIGFGGPWRVWFWTTYWDTLFTNKKPDDHAQTKALLATNLKEPHRMSALQKMASLSKAETNSLLSHSKVKTAVFMGTKDPDFENPGAEASYIAAKLGSDLHMVQNAGHYPHVEFPEFVASKIVEFQLTLKM